MYRFRRNVTVTAVETHYVHDRFDGPTRKCAHLQKYSLDAAVDPRDMPGLVTHRMGIGRITVRTF